MMTMRRLRALLGAYGADPARWPAGEREAAEALLGRSAEARALLTEATTLDRELDRASPAVPGLDPAAVAAAASAVPQRRRPDASPGRTLGHLLFGWPQLAGLAAAGIAGLAIGWSGLAPEAAPPDPNQGVPLFAVEEPLPW